MIAPVAPNEMTSLACRGWGGGGHLREELLTAKQLALATVWCIKHPGRWMGNAFRVGEPILGFSYGQPKEATYVWGPSSRDKLGLGRGLGRPG